VGKTLTQGGSEKTWGGQRGKQSLTGVRKVGLATRKNSPTSGKRGGGDRAGENEADTTSESRGGTNNNWNIEATGGRLYNYSYRRTCGGSRCS